MSDRVSFFVPGIPVAKGSLRAFTRRGGGVGVEEGNADKVRPWMSSISLAARDAGTTATDGPIRVGMTFVFPRPKGHFNSKGLVRGTAPAAHTKKPDIDKLIRAVLDALTGVAFADDSQVVTLEPASKRYARETTPPGLDPTGVEIVVEVVGERIA